MLKSDYILTRDKRQRKMEVFCALLNLKQNLQRVKLHTMERQLITDDVNFMAKPGIPVESPVRRDIPEIAYPIPSRGVPESAPSTPTTPTRQPGEPVPIGR